MQDHRAGTENETPEPTLSQDCHGLNPEEKMQTLFQSIVVRLSEGEFLSPSLSDEYMAGAAFDSPLLAVDGVCAWFDPGVLEILRLVPFEFDSSLFLAKLLD